MKKLVKNFSAWALLVVIAGVVFGSFAPIMVRYSDAPSLVLASYRKIIVTLLLLPVILLRHREELRRLTMRTIAWCCLSGFFLAIHFFTYYEGIKNTTIAASQVLTGLEVLFVAVIMFLSGKERYGAAAVLGIGLAFAGGIVVSLTPGGGASASNALYGNLCSIACALFSAFYSLIGTKVRQSCSTTVYTFLVYGASAVILTILVPVSGDPFTGYAPVNLAVAFGLAIFCSLLSHSLFNWALKYLSPTLITIFKQFSPVLSTVWGLLFFLEIPLWNQIAGGVVLLAGILLYTKVTGSGTEENAQAASRTVLKTKN